MPGPPHSKKLPPEPRLPPPPLNVSPPLPEDGDSQIWNGLRSPASCARKAKPVALVFETPTPPPRDGLPDLDFGEPEASRNLPPEPRLPSPPEPSAVTPISTAALLKLFWPIAPPPPTAAQSMRRSVRNTSSIQPPPTKNKRPSTIPLHAATDDSQPITDDYEALAQTPTNSQSPRRRVSISAELAGLKRTIIEAVWSQTLSDEAIQEAEEVYPEIPWLAECLQRAPLPVEWNRRVVKDAEGGSVCYVNSCTGDVLDQSPFFDVFVEMAHVVASATQDSDAANLQDCQAQVKEIREEALHAAHSLRDTWTQHMDPATGTPYYHNEEIGFSTWRMPASAQLYIAWVADRLLNLEGLFVQGGQPLAEQATPRPMDDEEV